MFYGDRDFYLSNFFISKIEDSTFREYSQTQLKCIKDYVYSKSCRRVTILNHFGEEVDYTECGNCDNCLNKNEENVCDFTSETLLILSLINKLNINYGITKIINILRGSKAKGITPFMKKLSMYGKGKEYSLKWWREFIRLLITYKYITEKTFGSRHGASVLECKLGKAAIKSKNRIIYQQLNSWNKVSHYQNKVMKI